MANEIQIGGKTKTLREKLAYYKNIDNINLLANKEIERLTAYKKKSVSPNIINACDKAIVEIKKSKSAYVNKKAGELENTINILEEYIG